MLDRSTPPALQEIASINLPEATVITLPNGSRIHCLFNDKQPVIKLEIVFKAGKWYETTKGVSYFTAKMLMEGTQNYSAKAIADKIAYYGASLECNQGYDRATLTLYCLTKHFSVLLQLVNDIVSKPTFPETEFTLLKKRTLQNILIEKEKNSYLANKLFTENVYGPNSPYISGLDEADIEAITLNQVDSFFNQNYISDGTEIFLSGDFESEQLDNLINHLSLTKGKRVSEKDLDIAIKFFNRDVKFERKDMLQSSIRIGCRFPLKTHPDYPKLSLLNKILGGYFGSRLMRNIRENKGYTYGIHSSLSAKEKDTLFSISTDVKGENTEQTIIEIYKEINLLKDYPIDSEELETVKNFTIGKLLNETTSIFDQSDKYKNIITHKLSPSYYTNYIQEVTNASAQDIMDVARQHLKDEELVQVIVGKV